MLHTHKQTSEIYYEKYVHTYMYGIRTSTLVLISLKIRSKYNLQGLEFSYNLKQILNWNVFCSNMPFFAAVLQLLWFSRYKKQLCNRWRCSKI